MKFVVFATLILNTIPMFPVVFRETILNAQPTGDSAASLPAPSPMPPPLPAPQDIPFPGTIQLHIDATDVTRGIYQIHESIPVRKSGPFTLLFPQWTPGDHAPNGPLEKLAALVVTAHGERLQWVRDTVAVYAFHVDVPAGADTLEVDYQYIGSLDRSTGYILIGPNMIDLQWQSVILYPSGYFARDITYQPSITLPDGWNVLSSLDGSTHKSDVVRFAPVALDKLVDSPVMAGRYVKQVIVNEGLTPVRLDVAVNDPADLDGLADLQKKLAAVAPQAYKLFAGQHYDHYDYMLWLSDDFGPMYFEHHRSGENWGPSGFLKSKDNREAISNMLHGYVHSWNGMYRRPAEMWTPDFNTPERDSMLWVFEGLTDYWQDVLSERTGLFTHDEILENYAELAAATTADDPGSAWRNLQDTTNGPVIWFRKPTTWPTWQLSMFDPYSKGEMIWLNVDVIIREQSRGKRSLDDFARSFYGGVDRGDRIKAYTFNDLVNALNAVQAYDWNGFFKKRLEDYGQWQSADVIEHSGYKLVFTDKPAAGAASASFLDLAYSAGMQVNNGRVVAVRWGGPAFNAKVTPGESITSVNGKPYSLDLLKMAVVQSADGAPLELVLKRGDRQQRASIDWHGGMRYPHLERISNKPAILDEIVLPKL